MTNLTNKEIKAICEDMRNKHLTVDWGFKIKQTKTLIKIYWGYLSDDFSECWTVNKVKEIPWVHDENGTLMNSYLEDDRDVEKAISSSVYYMVSRY